MTQTSCKLSPRAMKAASIKFRDLGAVFSERSSSGILPVWARSDLDWLKGRGKEMRDTGRRQTGKKACEEIGRQDETLTWQRQQPQRSSWIQTCPEFWTTRTFLDCSRACQLEPGGFHWTWKAEVQVGILRTCRSNRKGTWKASNFSLVFQSLFFVICLSYTMLPVRNCN